jgi:hypothetical protein
MHDNFDGYSYQFTVSLLPSPLQILNSFKLKIYATCKKWQHAERAKKIVLIPRNEFFV